MKLRMRAQEPTLKEIAKSKLRRLLAHNKTFYCAEIDVGDMALFCKAQNRKSSPRWRGPAKVLEIDETGVNVSFQSQNFKVARYCVRQRMKESEATEGDGGNPLNLGGPRMGPLDGGAGLVPGLPEDSHVDQEMADGEKPTESGGSQLG